MMVPSCKLIVQPSIDWAGYLDLATKMLGSNPVKRADGTARKISDPEKFALSLADMKDPQGELRMQQRYLPHLHYGVLALATEIDLKDILEICSEMPVVRAESVARGVEIAVISGNMARWRDAVHAGCQANVELTVRAFFNRLYTEFQQAGMSDAFGNFQQAPTTHGFYLEHKS